MEGYPKLQEVAHFSEQKLSQVREDLDNMLALRTNASKFCIVAVGSLARKEASEGSDLDFFMISDKGLKPSYFEENIDDIRAIIKTHMPRDPGNTGTFGYSAFESIEELVSNIGGDYDNNVKFTRRMLFLLEGTWLFNEQKFVKYRNALLERYIKEKTGEANLNYFFLNDVIRYYRTIATDYEFKVTEDGKEWGLRNIKLRFSRKLLYFSGLLVVAATTTGSQSIRIRDTVELLNMTPIERVSHLVAPELATPILQKYEKFSKKISMQAVRKRLQEVERQARSKHKDYRELRDLGNEFTEDLVAALNSYNPDSKFRTALLF